MAFSGSSAASEMPSASDVIAPVAGCGGGSLVTGAGVERALTSAAKASSAPIRSSSGRARTWPTASGGDNRLGLSG
jgi:hypothetical protein